MSAPLKLAIAAALVAAASPAWSLYKVIGPDGSITYTDRPPAAANARITSLGRNGETTPLGDASLPLELRQASARYPVQLYTAADCPPCDNARALLLQRGVPYRERRIASDDDTLALERLTGARTVPALTVGQQVLRGLAPADWNSYLDAAGYPKESKLPRSWQPPPVTPLTEAAPARTARPATEPASASPAEAPPPAEGGFRF
ncbi:glutaredoxin family protein [Rubrivivax gelatinosus]|uniref:Glutaredoxin-like protein n=1 Tax=Rubrivivax gelatinosus (strain NBRC 100245 / IL144) TaxID=983917 RepID=I0HRR4_RUBGI|nr:glutaredoxin family protein [Rubrivivax gelatinosus]BAL95701.1 glutaredoxin-like protein [Rubrivivax gelatinosus IL144]